MNELISFINPIADNWYSVIVPHSFQLLIIFAIIIIIDKLFKKQSAIFGYGLWLIFILKALIPIKISLFTNNETVSNIVYFNEIVAKPIEFTTQTNVPFSYESILFIIWIIGIIFLITKLIYTERHFHRILNNSEEIKENQLLLAIKEKIGIKKKVQLFTSEKIPAPFTIGIFKPKIFIPKELFKSNADQLKSILAHELAHIKRVDILPIMLQTIVNIFYFFNPFIWFANRNINFYRERVCDEIAFTNLGIEPKLYGKTLLSNLELLFVKKSKPIFANNLFLTKKIIIKRLESLFKQKEIIMLKLKKTQWIFLVMLVILTVMLSCGKESVNKEPSINNMEYYDSPPIPYGNIGILTIDNDPTVKNNKIAIQLRAGVLIDQKGVVKKISGLTVTQKMGKIFTIMNMSRDKIYNAVKSTKFKPAIKNNKPINAYVQIPIQIEFDQDMYLAALNSVNENITAISKVKSKVKFVEYDTSPKPIGGKKAILENIVYPKKAEEEKIEGTVVIQAFVNEHGVVSDWEIFQGIPNTGLNEAAIDAIKKTKFKPATKDKKPVGVWIAVPINFKLEK